MRIQTLLSRSAILIGIALVASFLLPSFGCTGVSEERARASIPGTWVGTHVAQYGPRAGESVRLELRVFTNGQYHFLVQGMAGLEISHAGHWIVRTGEGGTIELFCDHAPADQFEVLNLRTLRLFYQGSFVEFKRR